MLEVQDRSGVYDLLESQPLSDKYFKGAERANKSYQLWTRDTIPWSLECESNGRTQEEAIARFNGLSNEYSADIITNMTDLHIYCWVFGILGIVDWIAVGLSMMFVLSNT